MAAAVITETIARLASGGRYPSGRSSVSNTVPSTALSEAITRTNLPRRSRDVAEAFQLLLDLLFGVRFLELRDLFLERVGDELLDRGIAREVGVALDLGEERPIELDAGTEHGSFLLVAKRKILHAEFGDDRRGERLQIGYRLRKFAAREQHAGHGVRIHAVIAAPLV